MPRAYCSGHFYGASGDIGFTAKPSNINGLRAIRKRYLHQKLNNDLEFWGRSSDGAPFFSAQNQSRETNTLDKRGEPMNAQILALVNQKGGTAKTTSTVKLGVGLAQAGKRVLVVDADPQVSPSISLDTISRTNCPLLSPI